MKMSALPLLMCLLLALGGAGSASKDVEKTSEAARERKVATPRTMKDDDDDFDLDDLDDLLDDDSDIYDDDESGEKDAAEDDDEDEEKDDGEDEEPAKKPAKEASEKKDKDEDSDDEDESEEKEKATANEDDDDEEKDDDEDEEPAEKSDEEASEKEDTDEEEASAKDEEEEEEDKPKDEEKAEADDDEAEKKPKKKASKSEGDDDGDDEEKEDEPEKEDAEVEDEEDAKPKKKAAKAGDDEVEETKDDKPEKEEPEAVDKKSSSKPEVTDAEPAIPKDSHMEMAQQLPKKPAGDESQPNLSPDVVARLAAAQEALHQADEALADAQAEMNGEAPEASEEEVTPEKGGLDFQLVKEIAIPVVAFVIGAILHRSESTAIFGKLAMFFGAQTVMNLYMKEVLSGAVVDEEAGLHGFPSAFIVTALQQLVGFLCFGVVLLVLSCTPYAYTPKKITEPMEVLAVILFSFSFTLNIALNNFSISLLPLSVNLIIRSCLPLATYLSQRVASQCTNEPVKDARAIEVICMLLGVCCAAVAVVAKSNGGGGDDSQSKTLVFGVIVCVASLFSGAINLALAGVLGTSCKLNSLDTTVYMSVPAFLFLVLPSLFYRHPVSWPDHGNMTDWEVFMVVLDRKVSVVGLAAFSGVLALFYNVFQYGIVHSLSASYTAFAGNFNKAATIALGLLVGLERLPPGMWGIVMALACLGNIGAFTAFNIIKMQAKKEEPKKEAEDEKAELISEADKNKV